MNFSLYRLSVRHLVLAMSIMGITSCVHLSHVHTFATSVTQTLSAFDATGYGFVYSYQNYSSSPHLYDFNETDLKDNKLPLPILYSPADTSKTGDYTLAIKADAAITTLFNCAGSYFKGLAKLSDPNLANISFDSLLTGLKNDSVTLAKLSLTDTATLNTFSSIGAAVTKLLIGRYQEKKLRTTIIKYDSSVQIVLGAFSRIIDGPLLNALVSDEGLMRDQYTLLLANPYLSRDLKIMMIDKYKSSFTSLESKRLKLTKISAAFKKISADHHAIAEEAKNNSLSSAKMKALFNTFSADLQARLQQLSASW
jgi:hypothetical protein